MKFFLFAAVLFGFIGCNQENDSENENESDNLQYSIVLDTLMQGFNDTTSWFYPSVGVVQMTEKPDLLVMTIQQWIKGKSDVFTPVQSRYSDNAGQSWSDLENRNDAFDFRPAENGFETGMCNFTPKWHKESNTLLGTCHSVPYKDKKLMGGTRSPVWSTYDPEKHEWAKWQTLDLPDDPKYFETNACADQRVDLPNGDILFPIYYKAEEAKHFTTSVAKCSFDGKTLKYEGQGSELSIEIDRGLFEPSLTKYGDRYYLTMRNDQKGYWAVSNDGLNFTEPKIWHFDDGEEVGTYNTMQHWVTHSKGLFLVYTRKGADNDHIIRHRAPLFISQVDTSSMELIRDSERIVVPNRGVTIGNFSVSNISENETWVTVAELMRGGDEEQYGANGNVFAAKILWNEPNKLWVSQ